MKTLLTMAVIVSTALISTIAVTQSGTATDKIEATPASSCNCGSKKSDSAECCQQEGEDKKPGGCCCANGATNQEATRTNADQIQISVQKTCPVSGKKLGSMGEPIKVKIGEEETAFLCCSGCKGKEINAEHWETVQSNLAAAQKTCPVMGKPIDASAKSTVVNGRKIFVCCPPCIEKIKADPVAFVSKLDLQVEANTQSHEQHSGDRHDHSDHTHDK